MIIRITLKQIGKRRNKIQEKDFYLENRPSNVKELITEAVRTCVKEYNRRYDENSERVLSAEEITDGSEIGKIAFGINYGEKKADLSESLETAVTAFEDGLVRIFIEETEAESLEQKITLHEGTLCTFIKLTMLSGSMF